MSMVTKIKKKMPAKMLQMFPHIVISELGISEMWNNDSSIERFSFTSYHIDKLINRMRLRGDGHISTDRAQLRSILKKECLKPGCKKPFEIIYDQKNSRYIAHKITGFDEMKEARVKKIIDDNKDKIMEIKCGFCGNVYKTWFHDHCPQCKE